MAVRSGKRSLLETGLVPDEAFFRFSDLQRFDCLTHALTRRRAPGLVGEQEFNFKPVEGNGVADALGCRTQLAELLAIALENTVWFDPAEPGEVEWVSAEDRAKGALDWETRYRGTSGIVGQSGNLFLCTLANDNTIVILFDPRWYSLGLVSLDLARPSGTPIDQAIRLMEERGEAQRDEMIGLIATGVGPCCHTLADSNQDETRGQTNMWDLARTTMLQAGLRSGNVFNARACNACKDTQFFSRVIDGPSTGAGAVVIGVKDDGAFGRMLAARKASAPIRARRRRQEPRQRDPGLLEEERRLNAAMRCPHGEKKVYVRSVILGTSNGTTKPRIALRCAIIEHVGQAMGGYNIVDKEYIERVCCGDYESCIAYQEFRKRQRK